MILPVCELKMALTNQIMEWLHKFQATARNGEYPMQPHSEARSSYHWLVGLSRNGQGFSSRCDSFMLFNYVQGI